MPATDLIERLLAGAAVALLMIGAVTALVSANATKRLVGLGIAMLGALAALAALRAPEGAIIAGAAVLLAQVILGVAIIIRLHESYGGIETPDIDAADAEAEPRDAAQ
jgi:hypothetical protein